VEPVITAESKIVAATEVPAPHLEDGNDSVTMLYNDETFQTRHERCIFLAGADWTLPAVKALLSAVEASPNGLNKDHSKKIKNTGIR